MCRYNNIYFLKNNQRFYCSDDGKPPKYQHMIILNKIKKYIIIFLFDQLEACKVMRVDQLNADKNMWVKIFKKKILNYYLRDRFYPDVDFYGRKNGKIII